MQPDIVAHVINDNQNEDTTEYVQLENPPYENIEHGMTGVHLVRMLQMYYFLGNFNLHCSIINMTNYTI